MSALDGQIAHARHDETARRVEMPQHVALHRRANQDDVSAHPASHEGALRAIVTTREAGSDGREMSQRACARTNGNLRT
ncbi:hypothetical protein ACQR0Y_30790 [Bradyrhizobium oligotrophicum]|uniref:hypothetical protein n=1 Tax=Bradyrhizobium TaxID=374 RepID=UPI002916B86D|nr:hypothetical protein [Bradyrhizobium sp. SZCCHNR3003]